MCNCIVQFTYFRFLVEMGSTKFGCICFKDTTTKIVLASNFNVFLQLCKFSLQVTANSLTHFVCTFFYETCFQSFKFRAGFTYQADFCFHYITFVLSKFLDLTSQCMYNKSFQFLEAFIVLLTIFTQFANFFS